MCLVHTPGAPAPPPPPTYLHNPYLDGAAMGGGLNKGRNSLVTFGNGAMPAASTGAASPRPMMGPGTSLPSPNAGVTMPAGMGLMMGQPGTVVPTVGGVMAGSMAGRITPSTPPPGAMRGFAK